MKLSQLKAKIEEVMALHGDLDVWITSEGAEFEIDGFDFVAGKNPSDEPTALLLELGDYAR